MTFDPSSCNSQVGITKCIRDAAGVTFGELTDLLNPANWESCKKLQTKDSDYNKCLYDGYTTLIDCMDKNCSKDTKTKESLTTERKKYGKSGGFLDDLGLEKGGATTNKVSTVVVGFLVISSIIMNFL